MGSTTVVPTELRFPVLQDHVRSLKNPHNEGLTIIHAFVRVRDFKNGVIPDKVNPRSHEVIKGRIPEEIEGSLKDDPRWFHLLNRGCLILAKRAWYDNKTGMLHVMIESETEHGLADGATTDRVLAQVKREISPADFATLADEEIPAYLQDAYLHLEIVAGEIGDKLVALTRARNTSAQVKEFSLQDLGGGYDWLKAVLEESELRGRVRYRENEPKPVDVRTVLALLLLFHPKWEKDGKDPVTAYTSKGGVIEFYKDEEWKKSFERLAPVAVDILKLYDYVHVNFQKQYRKGLGGPSGQLGKRKEVQYYEKTPRTLPLTGTATTYGVPDGWLYPLLAAFRPLLGWPSNGRGPVTWARDPFKYFDEHGYKLVDAVVEQSENLGRNANATGKSRLLWSMLRTNVEHHLLTQPAVA